MVRSERMITLSGDDRRDSGEKRLSSRKERINNWERKKERRMALFFVKKTVKPIFNNIQYNILGVYNVLN